MKKYGLIVAMGIALLWAGGGFAAMQIETPVVDLVELKGLLSKAEVIVPEVNAKVKLKKGLAEYKKKPEHIKISLGKILGRSKAVDGSYEIYAEIITAPGGSGVFHYVGLFLVTGKKVTHTSSVLIGDRVNMLAVVHVCTQDPKICLAIVNFQAHHTGQALSELPTLKAEKVFKITEHKISQ
jgi:hypothetical protein